MSVWLAVRMLPGLVIGLTLHELAHAWSASLLGDDSARRAGRVSFNPFRHLSLLGTAALFLIGFGWAKPVMVNVYNFRHPKRDYLLTSLAGPAANVLIVLACSVLMLATRHTYRFESLSAVRAMDFAHTGLYFAAIINTILATLNLLPIPPLDGSKIWPVIVPGLSIQKLSRYSQAAMMLLVLLMVTNKFSAIFGTTVRMVRPLLVESDLFQYERRMQDAASDAQRKEYAKAAGHYAAAQAINPRSAVPVMWHGQMMVSLGRWNEALADFDAAIRMLPQRAYSHRMRAMVLRELGRFEEADAAEKTADTLDPRGPASQPDSPANEHGETI